MLPPCAPSTLSSAASTSVPDPSLLPTGPGQLSWGLLQALPVLSPLLLPCVHRTVQNDWCLSVSPARPLRPGPFLSLCPAHGGRSASVCTAIPATGSLFSPGLLLRALVSLPLLEGLWEDGTGEAVRRGGALACRGPGDRWVWGGAPSLTHPQTGGVCASLISC